MPCIWTILVYGAYDASMDVLAAHFGHHGARLSKLTNIRVAIFDDVDHALFNATHAAQVIALCESAIKAPDTRHADAGLHVAAHAVS